MKRVLTIVLILGLALSCRAYALTDEQRDAAVSEAAAAALAACVSDGMTDIERLTALHDWLALSCDYGATLRGTTAYGALVESTATCRGYAAGYAYLAEEAGLSGAWTYSETIDHAWILATLDGGRYFSDCTWDDGKHQRLGLIRHGYFLFDAENAGETGHYGWDSAEEVSGGALEAVPWCAAVTRVIFDGAYAYYIDGDFVLWRCDRDTWETEPLAVLGERWPGEKELYTSLIFMGGRLYFNTPYEICSVDLAGGDRRTLIAPDTSGGLVYGAAVRNGKLCYSIAADASAIVYDVVETKLSARGAWGY